MNEPCKAANCGRHPDIKLGYIGLAQGLPQAGRSEGGGLQAQRSFQRFSRSQLLQLWVDSDTRGVPFPTGYTHILRLEPLALLETYHHSQART